MKALWVSANQFGYELLKAAHGLPGFQLAAVVTLAQDAATVMYDGVERKVWREFGCPVLEVRRIEEAPGLLGGEAIDWGFACGWRQVVPASVRALPKKGFLGFHPTLLPRGRGPAPIINTILAGERKSGVTMFHLTDEMDAGDIVGQAPFDVGAEDHASDVYAKAVEAGRRLVKETVPRLLDGTSRRVPQDPSQASVFPKVTLADNEIDLEKEPLDRIHRKIRAFSHPYRGAFVKKDGRKLVLWRAELES